MPLLDQMHAEGFDRRRLAHSGYPGDADPERLPRVGRHPQQKLLRRPPVIGPGGLDERDRASEVGATITEDAVELISKLADNLELELPEVAAG